MMFYIFNSILWINVVFFFYSMQLYYISVPNALRYRIFTNLSICILDHQFTFSIIRNKLKKWNDIMNIRVLYNIVEFIKGIPQNCFWKKSLSIWVYILLTVFSFKSYNKQE